MALLHFDGFGAPFRAPSGNGDGMDAEAKLKDLREMFGKKSVLFAEDIAELIGADHATVKKIESGYGIPLPLKKVGNRYGVAIAQYTIKDDELHVTAPDDFLLLRMVQSIRVQEENDISPLHAAQSSDDATGDSLE
jgi:hypothetical protein